MSGGSYILDPVTGKRVRVGDAPKTPTRAERRAERPAADQAAAETAQAQAEADKPSGRSRPRRGKAPDPDPDTAVVAPSGASTGSDILTATAEE